MAQNFNMPNVAMSNSNEQGTVFRGAVTARGGWNVEPAAGWAIEHLQPGKYKITHFQKSLHYSVSLGAANGTVQEMTDNFFEVQLPEDADWTFAVSFLP